MRMTPNRALCLALLPFITAFAMGATIPDPPVDFTENDAAKDAYNLAYDDYKVAVGERDQAKEDLDAAQAAFDSAQAAAEASGDVVQAAADELKTAGQATGAWPPDAAPAAARGGRAPR